MCSRYFLDADGKPASTLLWSNRLELTLLRREAERLLNQVPRKKGVA